MHPLSSTGSLSREQKWINFAEQQPWIGKPQKTLANARQTVQELVTSDRWAGKFVRHSGVWNAQRARRERSIMDGFRAKRFVDELVGQSVAGWGIQEYINCGKSAIVFKAQNGARAGAIKLFDPEIVEKQGAEIQLQRIERERSLIGKTHPNLVAILDGGHWTGPDLPLGEMYFVVMEYLPWKNLAAALADVPVGSERLIIRQVASAARFLEGLGLCHRDIKPENIAISDDFQTVKLLDFGVIRPHGTKPITDGTHGKIFIGTLKYSPPEFLLRQEQDAPDGWRAITFYQIGAVLHDLIMRRPLFADFENPYARLVNAVQHEKPKIESKSVPPALVELARHCLVKPVATRLQIVSWEHFETEPSSGDPVSDLKSRILRRNLAGSSEPKGAEMTRPDADQRLEQYFRDLQTMCRLECVENRTVFPPVAIHPLPKTANARQFAVQFDPSTSHCLRPHLRIEFTVCWIDAGSDISEVLAAGLVSSKSFDARRAAANTTSSLFKGIYAPDTVRRAVVTALYRALDGAQQTLGEGSETTKSKASGVIHQLNLDGESAKDNPV